MPKPGDKLKHYEILEPLGKGGMGEVFLAQDTVLDRKVAVKFLPESMQKDEKARVRLLREAKAAAALDHPFICKIYETGEIDNKAYIVMEYIEGKDLREKLDEELLPLRDSLQMALEVAEALEEAHKKGIVHRDLKPSNIMLTPHDHVKVMDFGLAKQILPGGDEEAITKTLTQASLTEQGAIVGTLAYMSPEQARGDKLDARSDIFSLGILLYEMTSGKHPFSKSSPIETLSSILRDSTPAISVKPKIVNPVLSPILRKALAKEPENRYQKVGDLAIDIRKLLRETTEGARLFYRKRPVIASTAVIIAMLLTGIWWLTRRPSVGPQEIAPETISVVLADVQNKTGDPVFDGVLETVLGISLDGVSYISVYDGKQARQQAAHLKPGSGGRLDLEVAQLLCHREGINAVVSASIEPTSSGFLIKMWALDPNTSEKLAEVEQPIKTKGDFLKVADYLASKLRDELVEIPADSKEALIRETFTTTSLEAVKAYTNAQEMEAQGKWDEAIQEYQRTLDNDPNFGRAYSGLAVVYYNSGNHQKADEYYQKALQHIDQMNDREKFRTRGGYCLFKLDFPCAIEQYSALVEQFSRDSAGHSMLAFAYFQGRNMQKAYEEGSSALEHNPHHINTRYNLSWFAMAAGEFGRAEHEARTLVEERPEFAESYVVLALSALAQGQSDKASQIYKQLETISSFGTSVASTGLADLAVYEGRLADAEAILEKGIAYNLGNKQNDHAADKLIILANIYLAKKKKDLVLDTVDQAVDLSIQGGILFSAARIYIQAGMEDKARTLQGRLSKKVQPESQAFAKLIGGELSRARGDALRAINLFKEAQAKVDSWIGRFLLGQAYLEAEAYMEAHAEFDKCVKRIGEATSVFLNDLPSYRYFSPVYYYLGRAQEGLGSDAAKDSYQKFLRIKEKGDKSDPLIEDARNRLPSL